MKYYDLNKKVSYKNKDNLNKVLSYINSSKKGHRVYKGNYEGFDFIALLSMLGFNIRFELEEKNKGSFVIKKLHAYEQDSEALIRMVEGLK